MGDINIDGLKTDWANNNLEAELSSHCLKRLSLPATRITHKTSTSIDFICTNLQETEIDALILQTGLSDHTAQALHINSFTTYKAQQKFIMKRQLKQQNLDQLKGLLSIKNWESVLRAPDADTAFSTFQAVTQTALNIACPVKKTKATTKRKREIHYDHEVQVLKNAYIKALNIYNMTGTLLDKNRMHTIKKDYDIKLKTLQQNASANYVSRADNKTKALWDIINNERKGNKADTSELQIETSTGKEGRPTQIAEQFNIYFTQIAELTLKQQNDPQTNEDQNKEIKAYVKSSATQPLILTPTNKTEVKNVIDSLKTKPSSGVDEYSSRIVKHCADELITPLVTIINKSFQHGQFPTALKVSKVYPKHKKGSHTDVKNYRPISLVSTFSKVIEKVVLNRLMPHLRQQNLITKSQHGFLRGKSTTTAITSLVEHVIDKIDDEQFVSALFLDYSKAFDCLGHNLVTTKLEHLGIRGPANKWFLSYLSGRSQLVEIKHTTNNVTTTTRSKLLPVTRGVPQGSVLGPVLFILFINDFPDYVQGSNINTNCLMYADDSTLIINSKTATELFSSASQSLKSAIKYCKANNLAVNHTKTVQINFSKRKEQAINIPNIQVDSHVRFLGVILDSNLSWNEHVNRLCKKVSTGVYVVRRIMQIGGVEAAKTAYHAIIESHLRYGLTVWGGSSNGNLNRLLLLQKMAIRALANLPPLHSCREAFQSLGILTVTAMYIQEVILHVDKLSLQRVGEAHVYNTRHTTKYVLPHHRTSLYEKKPSYIGRKLWNMLPQNIQILKGKTLQKKLRDYLINHPVYTMEEFMAL